MFDIVALKVRFHGVRGMLITEKRFKTVFYKKTFSKTGFILKIHFVSFSCKAVVSQVYSQLSFRKHYHILSLKIKALRIIKSEIMLSIWRCLFYLISYHLNIDNESFQSTNNSTPFLKSSDNYMYFTSFFLIPVFERFTLFFTELFKIDLLFSLQNSLKFIFLGL